MPRPRAISAKNRPYKHVELSDGDWINLKQKLNYGEASELYDATYRSGVGGAERGAAREVRMSVFNIQRIFIYTLEWSFIDDENKPLPLSAESIRDLDTETTEEIHKAISDLEAENDRAAQAKNAGTGRMGTTSTSPGSLAVQPASGSQPANSESS